MNIVVDLLFGLVSGAVTFLLGAGPALRSWMGSIAIAAMVGGVLASALGWNGENDGKGYRVALIGAIAWVGINRLVRRRYAVPAH